VRQSLPFGLVMRASSKIAFLRRVGEGMWWREAIHTTASCVSGFRGSLSRSPFMNLALCSRRASWSRGVELSIPVYLVLSFLFKNAKNLPLPHPMSATLLPGLMWGRISLNSAQSLLRVFEKSSAMMLYVFFTPLSIPFAVFSLMVELASLIQEICRLMI